MLLDDLTESFNFHKLTQETFDVQSFADSVEAMPMMAEHTMVQVDDIDIFRLPESDRQKMAVVILLILNLTLQNLTQYIKTVQQFNHQHT